MASSFPFSPQQSRAGIPEVHYGPEKSGMTWKKGAVIVRDANGFFAEAGAAPATFFGFAVEEGQNLATDGAKQCGVYRPRPGERFEGVLLATYAITQLGENYGLVKNGTTGYWEIEDSDVADQVTVCSVSSQVKVGDVNPIVDFTVDQANLQEI